MSQQLAFRIASRVLRVASLAENLDKLMSEECAKYKISVKVETNWYGLALKASQSSGVRGADAEEVAAEAVHSVLFGEKTQEEKTYSQGYIFSNILPNLVAKFKSQGWSITDIKKDKKTQEFFERNGVPVEKAEKKIEEFYKSNKKPRLNTFTGAPVDVDLLGKRKLTERNFFESFDPSRSPHIEAYFYEAVKNKAINIVEARDKMLQEALSIQPESRSEDYVPRTVDESKLGEDDGKAEHKILLKELIKKLKKIDPLYSKALEMMNLGWDIASNEFAKCLPLNVSEFLIWRKGFLKALHQVSQKGDVTRHDLEQAVRYGMKKAGRGDIR